MQINELEKKLNYKFKNLDLLKISITHSSYKSKFLNEANYNYERLEFLGDRVLGLILADYFFNLYPNAREGELNHYYQNFANQNTLANYAQKIGLSNFIKIQKGDNLENNKSILSDIVESIIASIFIDSGFLNSKKFVIDEIINSSIAPRPKKHAKSILQEICLDRYKCLPKYSLINNGWFKEERIIAESLIAFKRAGCNGIITYFAPYIAKVINQVKE